MGEKKWLVDEGKLIIGRSSFALKIGGQVKFYYFSFDTTDSLLLPIEYDDIMSYPKLVVAHESVGWKELEKVFDRCSTMVEHPLVFGDTPMGILKTGKIGNFTIGPTRNVSACCSLNVILADESIVFIPYHKGSKSVQRAVFKPVDNKYDGLVYLIIGWNPKSDVLKFFKLQD